MSNQATSSAFEAMAPSNLPAEFEVDFEYDFDSHGDVLVLTEDVSGNGKFRASSQILRLASAPFDRMFGGTYAEGQALSATNPPEVYIHDETNGGLRTLLHILHDDDGEWAAKEDRPSMALRVLVAADKWACQRRVHEHIKPWFASEKKAYSRVEDLLVLWTVAYKLRDATAFREMSIRIALVIEEPHILETFAKELPEFEWMNTKATGTPKLRRRRKFSWLTQLTAELAALVLFLQKRLQDLTLNFAAKIVARADWGGAKHVNIAERTLVDRPSALSALLVGRLPRLDGSVVSKLKQIDEFSYRVQATVARGAVGNIPTYYHNDFSRELRALAARYKELLPRRGVCLWCVEHGVRLPEPFEEHADFRHQAALDAAAGATP